MGVEKQEFARFLENPLTVRPSAKTALEISRNFSIPLHPGHTFYWSTLTNEQLIQLVNWLVAGEFKRGENRRVIQKEHRR